MSGVTRAATTECNPDKDFWEKMGNTFQPLDIRKTTTSSTASAIIDNLTQAASGRNGGQETRCIKGWLEQLLVILSPSSGLGAGVADLLNGPEGLNAVCPGLLSEQCTDLVTTWGSVGGAGHRNYDYKNNQQGNFSYRNSQGAGSLIGIANMVQSTSINEPIPSNLALAAFWNDGIKNIPLAGQALAADVQYDSLWGIVEASLSVWKVFRNLAYGILAIVMITVGIMIMVRKKLPPQLTVTVQYAIPRVALSVILITFSYPLVAVVAKGVWYIKDLIVQVIAVAAVEDGINSLFPVPIGTLYLLFKMKAYMISTPGWTMLIGVGLTSVASLIFWILVWLRSVFIYVKMVFSAIFGPIQFAVATIPGNEKLIENWLKNLLVDAASIIAMYAYANVVVLILLLILFNPAPSTGAGATATIVMVVLYPFFSIWGFYQAFRVPGVVKNAIMGEQRGGKR